MCSFVFNRPTGQLDAYIKNLERVLDAIEFFNQNNPNCMELSNLVCYVVCYGHNKILLLLSGVPCTCSCLIIKAASWFGAEKILA